MIKSQEYFQLTAQIRKCKKCPLHKSRIQAIPGDGPLNANIMLIGEAPGREEDACGHPFVGKAGKILDPFLKKINLSRNEIYITNLLKCHPPKNHAPQKTEILSCIGYLIRQIDLIQPRLIFLLGCYASKETLSLFDFPFTTMKKEHGKIFEASTSYATISLIPIYHPAACYSHKLFDLLEKDFMRYKNKINRVKKGGE